MRVIIFFRGISFGDGVFTIFSGGGICVFKFYINNVKKIKFFFLNYFMFCMFEFKILNFKKLRLVLDYKI